MLLKETLDGLPDNCGNSETVGTILVSQDNPREDIEYLKSLAALYYKQGEFSIAEHIYRRIAAINPHCGEAHYGLGLVHSRLSRADEAEKDFHKAIEINPGDPSPHNDLGVLYYDRGDSKQAREHFLKALEADVLYEKALLNLFEVCLDAESYSEGLAWIEKHINANSGKDRPVNSMVASKINSNKGTL